MIDHKRTEHVAAAICKAMGHEWPCPYHRYSMGYSKEAVSKYWIEVAEHAIAASDAYEETVGG